MPVLTTASPPQAVPLRLGYLALIPFVLGALLVWLVRGDAHAYAAVALSSYAAVVVAFLGGVHWGFGFQQRHPETRLFVWGVIPALVAWVGVMMQPYAGLVVHGAMLVACYLVDRRVYPRHGAAAWLTLRFRLSVVASLASFVGAAGA